MKALLCLFAVSILAACSSTSKDEAPAKAETAKQATSTPQASIEAKQLAAENEATFVSEVAFAKGKTALSPAATKRIGEIIKQARLKGKIDEVTVISWADREYPSTNAGELSKDQQKLAKERAEVITKYLKNQERGIDVETYNMAERPNALERLLSTTDARLKRSLEAAGIPNTDTSVKTPSKASKAIVMIVLEKKD